MTSTEYSRGQQWGALKKAWKGYRIAKVQHDQVKMMQYALKIRSLCMALEITIPKFPELSLE